jgi:glycerol-3-phosphate acyltransferase PlsY
MDLIIGFLSFLSGYLIGAISFSRIVTRIVDPNVDLNNLYIPVAGTDEKYHMTAMGGTAAGMALGRKVGCTVGFLDILKAIVPTLLVRFLIPEQPYYLITGLATVIGHNWPVYYGFKGGRGISAVYGAMLVVDWLGAILTAMLGMVFGMAIVRDLVVAYLAGMWFMIPWMFIRNWGWPYIAFALALNVVFMLAMIPEIRQIIEMRRRIGGKGDMASMMRTNPMGQMMLEWGEKLGLMKNKGS